MTPCLKLEDSIPYSLTTYPTISGDEHRSIIVAIISKLPRVAGILGSGEHARVCIQGRRYVVVLHRNGSYLNTLVVDTKLDRCYVCQSYYPKNIATRNKWVCHIVPCSVVNNQCVLNLGCNLNIRP